MFLKICIIVCNTYGYVFIKLCLSRQTSLHVIILLRNLQGGHFYWDTVRVLYAKLALFASLLIIFSVTPFLRPFTVSPSIAHYSSNVNVTGRNIRLG